MLFQLYVSVDYDYFALDNFSISTLIGRADHFSNHDQP